MDHIRVRAVGADPELFFVTPQGVPMSVEGFVPGTKDKPVPMKGLPEGFNIQADNVAAEFNIPPAASMITFAQNVASALKYVQRMAEGHGLKTAVVADLDFPLWQLQTPHAKMLGCEPDYCVWTKERNPRPQPPEQMRTAAGHVHVSWENPNPDQQVMYGKALDLYLGVPSVLVTEKNRRRELYGKAGAVRFKDYGIEYRTLDNFWITSKRLSQAVYRNVFAAAEWLNQSPMASKIIEDYAEEIRSAINNHDKEVAERLVTTFGIQSF